MKRKDIYIAFAKQLIDVARNKFVEIRSDEAFEILNADVKSFINENCSKLDVKTEFKEKRIAKKKKSMAGELSRDKMVDDPTTRFKSETYVTILDSLVTQIDDRFNDFRSTVTYFYCIDPSQML